MTRPHWFWRFTCFFLAYTVMMESHALALLVMAHGCLYVRMKRHILWSTLVAYALVLWIYHDVPFGHALSALVRMTILLPPWFEILTYVLANVRAAAGRAQRLEQEEQMREQLREVVQNFDEVEPQGFVFEDVVPEWDEGVPEEPEVLPLDNVEEHHFEFRGNIRQALNLHDSLHRDAHINATVFAGELTADVRAGQFLRTDFESNQGRMCFNCRNQLTSSRNVRANSQKCFCVVEEGVQYYIYG
jgi:hypothetical protein